MCPQAGVGAAAWACLARRRVVVPRAWLGGRCWHRHALRAAVWGLPRFPKCLPTQPLRG